MSRKIAALQSKLAAIENRELWPLTSGEQARAATHATRAGVRIARGKAPARAGRALDRVFEDAARRVGIELDAERQIEQKKHQAKVDARVARKGWW